MSGTGTDLGVPASTPATISRPTSDFKATSFCSCRRPLLRFLLKIQRRRVHAIPQTRRAGAVGKHVPQMRIAPAAYDLSTPHSIRPIVFRLDGILVNRSRKARPSRTRLELRVRLEQRIAATRAAIRTFIVVVPILTGEGALSAFLPSDVVLLRRQLPFPFLV